jgi:hypothetical protein
MLRKIQISILFSLALVVAVFLLLDIACYINGSPELFPTDEQQEKIKIFTVAVGIPLAYIEAALVLLLVRQQRK